MYAGLNVLKSFFDPDVCLKKYVAAYGDGLLDYCLLLIANEQVFPWIISSFLIFFFDSLFSFFCIFCYFVHYFFYPNKYLHYCLDYTCTSNTCVESYALIISFIFFYIEKIISIFFHLICLLIILHLYVGALVCEGGVRLSNRKCSYTTQ